MKSPICKYLTMAAWLIVTIIALNFGLRAFNQGFLDNMMILNNNMNLVQYVVLGSAVWMGYLFIMALQGQCGGCGSKKGCKC